MVLDPAAEYGRRLADWRARFAQLSRLDARLASGRLITFGAALVIGYLIWSDRLGPWALAAPAVAFLALAVRHDVVIRARERAATLVTFYEHGLGRIEDRWTGTGQTGDRFRNDHHPYANDLDLFGPGSLFELLSRARTRTGEDTLASWLTAAATPLVIAARQESLRELAPNLDLREELALATGVAATSVRGEALVAWAEAPPVLSPPWLRWVALGLTVSTLLAISYLVRTGSVIPLYVTLAAQSLFALPYARRVERLLHVAGGPALDLMALSHAITVLETARFTAPRLVALQEEIRHAGLRASTAIRRLRRISEMHDWQHNMMFVPVALVLMWSTHLAWALEAWRRAHRIHVGTWLRVVGEFEALASLSAYAFEHPDDPFPELDVREAPAGVRTIGRFEGIGLGHPLVPAARMTRNDVTLSSACQLLVVSGSNMSGKSTLLRTVGVCAVLAQAGAPVRARSLRLTPLAVGATLRIQDSLQEGRSRFYAEITRIRELSDLSAGPLPLLFLLDEIFHGTNSHDRLVGASGVLGSLVDRGAIGLITTHDLALTAVVDSLSPRAINVHFEDWFDGDEMRFDYTVKPGPVTRSNALALMRAVGLDVGEAPS
jgi:hypothetical protein